MNLVDLCYFLFLQVKVWFQNRRMKWRHAEEAKRQAKQDDTSSGDHPENQDENPDIDVSALEDPDDSDHVDPCTLDDEEEEMEERELQIMEMKNQEENATKPLTETLCAESEVSWIFNDIDNVSLFVNDWQLLPVISWMSKRKYFYTSNHSSYRTKLE